MLREMNAIDWLEWKTYMQLAPSGSEVDSLLMATVASAAWNVEVAKAQGSYDAAKRKRGARPEFRPFHTFVLRLGDMPDYAPPPPDPKQRGRALFDAFVDHFQALGLKPVKR